MICTDCTVICKSNYHMITTVSDATDCTYLLLKLMVLYTNSSVRLDAVENMTVIGILVYDWLMLKDYDADLCFSSLDIIESNMLIFKFFYVFTWFLKRLFYKHLLLFIYIYIYIYIYFICFCM